MNTEQILLRLLQPKGYKSKIKLYCTDCKPAIINTNGKIIELNEN